VGVVWLEPDQQFAPVGVFEEHDVFFLVAGLEPLLLDGGTVVDVLFEAEFDALLALQHLALEQLDLESDIELMLAGGVLVPVEEVDGLGVEPAGGAVVVGRDAVEVAVFPVGLVEEAEDSALGGEVEVGRLHYCRVHGFVVVFGVVGEVGHLRPEHVYARVHRNVVVLEVAEKVHYVLITAI